MSGIEASIVLDELWFGSMPGATKAHDLRRDACLSLHGPPVLLDADDARGDTKLSGRAHSLTSRG
ncbi:hypothetical protein ABZW11_18055 [Nonomuraea sp. NPDC004580]|uniref:hypothetical protein n=1 Tax=Nonomuraea sp. NPDC004580 TaxID=3154552 RepID=UPI0033B0ABD9